MYKNLRMLILAGTLLPCQGMAAIDPSFGFPDASAVQVTKGRDPFHFANDIYDEWNCAGSAQVNGEQIPVFGSLYAQVDRRYNPQEIPRISHLLKTEERVEDTIIYRTGVYKLAPRHDGIQYNSSDSGPTTTVTLSYYLPPPKKLTITHKYPYSF